MVLTAERAETGNGINGKCPTCRGLLKIETESTPEGKVTFISCWNCGAEWGPEILAKPAGAAESRSEDEAHVGPESAAQTAADDLREFRKVRLTPRNGTMIWPDAAREWVLELAAANPDLTRNAVAGLAAERSNLSRDWVTKTLRAAEGLPESAKGKPGRPAVTPETAIPAPTVAKEAVVAADVAETPPSPANPPETARTATPDGISAAILALLPIPGLRVCVDTDRQQLEVVNAGA